MPNLAVIGDRIGAVPRSTKFGRNHNILPLRHMVWYNDHLSTPSC